MIVYPGNHGETYLIIPNFVEFIADGALCASSMIKFILIHPSVKRIGFQFFKMDVLEYVNIQNHNLPSLELGLSSTVTDHSIIYFNPLPKVSINYCYFMNFFNNFLFIML